MSRISRVALLSILGLVAVSTAKVWKVPEWRREIQEAIESDSVVDGDTISVWGPPPGQTNPPYVYNETLNLRGKNLVIASRCFLPGWQGCEPTYDSVIVDGGGQGLPVFNVGSRRTGQSYVTIKGLTIRNGGNGGGVRGESNGRGVLRIEKCYIHHCYDCNGQGGGVHYWADTADGLPDTLLITGCRFEYDSADYGGGIYAFCIPALNSGAVDRVLLKDDTFRYNGSKWGGGLYLLGPSGRSYGQETDDQLLKDTVIINNLFEANRADSGGGGGGIWVRNYPGRIRNTTFKDNSPDGIFLDLPGQGVSPVDLGCTASGDTSWGMNVFQGNDPYNAQLMGGISVYAKGNFWQTLHTSGIRGKINNLGLNPNPSNFLFDPPAASSKYFSINSSTVCSTSALITGDLLVKNRLEFVAPLETPRSVLFFAESDFELDGTNPQVGLIVHGDSACLIAKEVIGMDTSIIFRAFRPDDNGIGKYYGVRLIKAGRPCSLRYCSFRDAYIGVEQDSSELHLLQCNFAKNLFGLFLINSRADVTGCKFISNRIWGIEATNLYPNSQIYGNTFSYNQFGGLQLSLASGSGSSIVSSNQFTNGPQSSGYYGIIIHGNGHELHCDSNKVRGFTQAGIVTDDAAACSLRYNFIVGDSQGLVCEDRSVPLVRYCVFDTWATDSVYAAVLAVNQSHPDLGDSTKNHTGPGNNSFLHVAGIAVAKDSSDTVMIMAELNWWNGPPEPRRFRGLVDYIPWLTEPPEGAQTGARVEMVKETKLYACQPNPFPVRTAIRFQVAREGRIRVLVADITGR